jgi:hypothetical protein
LRRAGENLQSQFGPTAQRILNDALQDADREVDIVLSLPWDASNTVEVKDDKVQQN